MQLLQSATPAVPFGLSCVSALATDPPASNCSHPGHGNGHHSITSSARASSAGGTVRPRPLAVFRLMISSTFVACCTQRGDFLAPKNPGDVLGHLGHSIGN